MKFAKPPSASEVRKSADLRAVMGAYGVEFDATGAALCPFHDDSTPSLRVWVGDDGAQRFHCFPCGAGGDAIDFVQRRGGLSFGEALAAVKDGDFPPPPDVAPRELPPDLGRRVDAGKGRTEVLARLLSSKGLDVDPDWAAKEFRLSEEGDVLLVPHYEADGTGDPVADLAGGKYRLVAESGMRTTPTAFPGSKLTGQLYGSWRDVGQQQVVVCEGETDTWAVAWWLRDDPSVLVVGLPTGAQPPRSEWLHWLEGRDVTALFDDDDAGWAAAEQWGLEGAAVAELAELPAGRKDASDAGEPLVRKALREARELPASVAWGLVHGHDDEGLSVPSRGHDAPSVPAAPARLPVPQRRDRSLTSNLLSMAEVESLPAPVWLVDGALPMASSAVLYAPQGSFKSFVAMDLAWSVASGRAWLGDRPVRRGKVLYVAGEGAAGTRKRGPAWRQFHGASIDELDGFVLHRGQLNLYSPDDYVEELAELVECFSPTLVVFDTFRRMSGGADENATVDVGRVVDNVEALRLAAGDEATSLVVHHSNAAGTKWRGNTAIGYDADVVMSLDRAEGELGAVLHWVKMKDEEEPKDVALAMLQVGGSLVVGPGQEDGTGVRPTEGNRPLRERLLAAMAADRGEWFSVNALRTAAGGKAGTHPAILERMAEAGLCESMSGARGAKLYRVVK